MAYQVSPGIVSREWDLSTVVPGTSTVEGAIVIDSVWGPVNEIKLIGSELELIDMFGKPNQNNFVDFFTGASFLSYADSLRVVRANANSNTAVSSTGGVRIPTKTYYEETYLDGSGSVGSWAAKWPGSLGNSLKVSSCPSANAFSATQSLTANVTSGNTQIVFSAALSTDTVRVPVIGDYINIGATTGDLLVTNVSGSVVTVNTAPTVNLTANTVVSKWRYADEFDAAPGTSDWVSYRSGSNDEMHVIVIDEDGQFTGVPGTILEKFPFVSKASDAQKSTGDSNYYVNVMKDTSKYIWWMDHQTGGTNWGTVSSGTTFTAVNSTEYSSLAYGGDSSPTDAQKILAYDKFVEEDQLDIAFVMTAAHSATVVTHVIQSICEVRGDCVAFVSPRKSDVVNNSGSEATSIGSYGDSLPSSTYAFMTDNWKYMFDKYNNTYRWIPDNGDVAGIASRSHTNRDPWYSFAGYNRGIVKNAIKMAWKSNKTTRDYLYKKGINSIITETGEGFVLLGDKTKVTKPSAFDRINVRFLFIVLKKSISKAAKYTLFELNNRFTRAQFVAMVEPFMRNVRARHGVDRFTVVCDESNNTGDVISRNEFVGDIYVVPAYSINYITLNFVAVGPDVAFNEVVGQYG